MYCAECNCEYVGWANICPVCKSTLINSSPPEFKENGNKIPYKELLDLVNLNGGQLQIELTTTAVEKKRTWRFPYRGYGYAWVKRMKGEHEGITIDLDTSEVGTSHKWRFPYFGYGYAWEKSMVGDIGGNELSLSATRVNSKATWGFPFFGFGHGWTESLAGHCGEQLEVEVKTVEVCRRRGRRFPYLGYGYAWTQKGSLILKTRKQ
jgi:hypothetical protein